MVVLFHFKRYIFSNADNLKEVTVIRHTDLQTTLKICIVCFEESLLCSYFLDFSIFFSARTTALCSCIAIFKCLFQVYHSVIPINHKCNLPCIFHYKFIFRSDLHLTLTLPGPSAAVSGSLDSYCSIKPLCSGMGEVVLARTSPTLLPPSPPTVLSLSCFKVSQCINCCNWHCKS